jgi:putative CocE/NonD family hydrolase
MREQVPALKAVAPIFAATDLHHVMFVGGRHKNDSGAAHIELMFRWSYLVIHLMAKPWGMLEAMFTFFRGTGKALRDAYMHAPIDEVDTKFLCPDSEPLSWFHDAFAHPLGTEDFWEEGKKKFVDIPKLDKDKVPPVLLLGGWYDFFCAEQLHDYQDLSQLSNKCHLVVGPFTHWCIMAMQPKMFRSLFDFFDFHLMEDPCAKRLPPVEVFEMGHEMGWHRFQSWPPPNVSNQRYILTKGDGNELLMQLETKDGEDLEEIRVDYNYDPADPTPQIGGNTFNPMNCGRLSQNNFEKRDDVLVFTSKPLAKPMTIAGQIKVVLHVISNVEGTDYVARACHVTPEGVSENVAEGICRRFDLRPGTESMIEIVLSPVMNRFGPGDRLRIHICSAAFPKHGRHLNTSDSFHLATEHKLSKQQVILGGREASRVLVPILAGHR